jgi:hypothetical protein
MEFLCGQYLLPPRSWKHFISCSPIPGRNGVIGADEIITPDLLKAISQALVQGGTFSSQPITLITLKRSKRSRRNLDLAIVDPAVSIFRKADSARIFQRQLQFHWLELRKFRR